MLIQIRCNKFTEKVIHLHPGLNAVIGDDLASNSIGKSTLLMIIDFAFGGSDYISKNHDAVEELGPHEFNFVFDFAGEKLYFTRGTNTYLSIKICNASFIPQSEIKLEDYVKLLQRKYRCEIDDLGFRSIVGRYFRVYGKENLNEHKPIQYFEKESASDSILALIKLFDMYRDLKAFEEQINTLDEDKKVLAKAAKKELIPNVTRAGFGKNTKKIEALSQQLEALKADILNATTDIEVLITKEILQLKKQKSDLSTKRNVLSARLTRIETNLQNKNINLDLELEQFILYFPGFNIDQARKIDDFHEKLTRILKDELQIADRDLRMQIAALNSEIAEIDSNIMEKLSIKNAPKLAIDEVVDLVAEIKQLSDENGYFTKAQKIISMLQTAKADLLILKERILDDICSRINMKMFELNKQVYVDKRRAPTLNIHSTKYTFNTYGDTGTGTAFANLITFDLALLDLTCLPALAHDLPLLKNIENPALERIISLYVKHKKQIFIAIDKIHSYDDATAKLINAHQIIMLSKDKTLFIKNWKSTK